MEINYEYEERAAIKEFDAFIPRDKAELEAKVEIAMNNYLASPWKMPSYITKNIITNNNID